MLPPYILINDRAIHQQTHILVHRVTHDTNAKCAYLAVSSYIIRSYDHCKLSSPSSSFQWTSFQTSSSSPTAAATAAASQITRFWYQSHHIAYPHFSWRAHTSERICVCVYAFVFVYITEEKTTTTDLYVLHAKKDRKKLNCHLVDRPCVHWAYM